MESTGSGTCTRDAAQRGAGAHTGQVELVQAVVSHGGVAGALPDVVGGRRVGAQPPGAGGQPAAHPEALEQVAQQGPEQAAGQVPVGGGQRAPQRPQRRPQVLGALGEVPLRPRGQRRRGISAGAGPAAGGGASREGAGSRGGVMWRGGARWWEGRG